MSDMQKHIGIRLLSIAAQGARGESQIEMNIPVAFLDVEHKGCRTKVGLRLEEIVYIILLM
jgi:hypothetical protein